MKTDLQVTPYQKQHDLQFDLVTELLKTDDDATALGAGVREKLTELKQLSIELQRKPFEETFEAADAGSDIWTEAARKALEAGLQYFLYWTNPGKAGALFNNSNEVITVLTYDQRDFLHWIPYGRFTIEPHKPAVIFARGDTSFQAAMRGKIFNIRIGGQHVYDGNTVMTR